MGGRQSYLYIYLKNKQEQYGDNGYTVKRSVESVSSCRNYEVVNHTITYTHGNGEKFDIYIYDTESMDSNASYIFAYCSPGVHSHVANQVKAYYSILAPNFPLAISFAREHGHIHHCDIERLSYDRWNWAAYITEYALGTTLEEHLQKAYEKRFWNITIGFVVGVKQAKDVLVFPRKIDKKNYRLVFIPSNKESVLGSDCLFNFDTKLQSGSEPHKVQVGCQVPSDNKCKNQIDSYFLDSVKGQYYNGIIVYYARESEQEHINFKENHNANTAILVEFVYLCKTISLRRKDKNGIWWSEEPFSYTDNGDLQKKVLDIYNGFKDTNINAVILEKTSKYLGVSDCSGQDSQAYVKYTHKFGALNKTVLLFERKCQTKGPLASDVQAKQVCVYYLKVKATKGDGKDTRPFLISLYKDDSGKPEKVYHFKNTKKFDDWIEFKGDDKEALEVKLERKLKDIDTSGSCTLELYWLRMLSHHILTTEAPPPPKPPKPPEDEQRPAIMEQEIPPIPPNLLLIIGCSVGGVALLILSIVGYGIYWYNTTIKLLT